MLIIHEDWRESKDLNCFKAFFKRKMLSSDYANFFSILFFFILTAVFAVVVAVTSDTLKLRGASFSIVIFVLFCELYPISSHYETLSRLNFVQILLMVLGGIATYLYGALVMVDQYDGIDGEVGAILYGTLYIFFLPIVVMGYAIYKDVITDRKLSKLGLALAIVIVLHLIGFGLFLILTDFVAAGCGVYAVMVIAVLIALVYRTYVKNNHSFPRWILYAFYITLGIILLMIFIIAIIVDDFNEFTGFSISFLLIALILGVNVLRRLVIDFKEMSKKPVFYSPWIFPIYRYDPEIGTIRKYNE
mmetsp:Transcript_963/g.880  ORF Transcript_963/g.880 Transcript_963/m.880 type:complete len:303 (-) Transcript_963:2447-3355(-)